MKDVRLIDANALLEDVQESVVFTAKDSSSAEIRCANKIIEMIKAAETIDTESLRHKWVSVKDRLPEKDLNVLMLFKGGNMVVWYLNRVDEDWRFWDACIDDGFYAECDSEQTHWMPLPENPKEN